MYIVLGYCMLLFRHGRSAQTQVMADADTLMVEQRAREMNQLEVR